MPESLPQPQIVQREGFTVIGFSVRGNPSTTDYRDLWENRYGPYDEAVKELSAEPGYYSIYICHTGTPEGVETVAGMAVRPEAEPPGELVKREVPPGVYAVFPTPFNEIGATWQRVAEQWQPGSDYEFDSSRPDFEHFLGEGEGRPPQVHIWVSVKPKQ